MLSFLLFRENQKPSDFMLSSAKITGLSGLWCCYNKWTLLCQGLLCGCPNTKGSHFQNYCEVFSFYSDDSRNVLNKVILRKLAKNIPCFIFFHLHQKFLFLLLSKSIEERNIWSSLVYLHFRTRCKCCPEFRHQHLKLLHISLLLFCPPPSCFSNKNIIHIFHQILRYLQVPFHCLKTVAIPADFQNNCLLQLFVIIIFASISCKLLHSLDYFKIGTYLSFLCNVIHSYCIVLRTWYV